MLGKFAFFVFPLMIWIYKINPALFESKNHLIIGAVFTDLIPTKKIVDSV